MGTDGDKMESTPWTTLEIFLNSLIDNPDVNIRERAVDLCFTLLIHPLPDEISRQLEGFEGVLAKVLRIYGNKQEEQYRKDSERSFRQRGVFRGFGEDIRGLYSFWSGRLRELTNKPLSAAQFGTEPRKKLALKLLSLMNDPNVAVAKQVRGNLAKLVLLYGSSSILDPLLKSPDDQLRLEAIKLVLNDELGELAQDPDAGEKFPFKMLRSFLADPYPPIADLAQEYLEDRERDYHRDIAEEEAKLAMRQAGEERLRQEEEKRRIEEARRKAEEEEHARKEQEILSQLKDILAVSTRVKVSALAAVLNLEENFLWKRIFPWAKQFGFTVDGDYLTIKKENVEDFIQALDDAFLSWKDGGKK